MRQMGNQQQD